MCGTFYLFGSHPDSLMLLALAVLGLFSTQYGQEKYRIENESRNIRLVDHRERPYVITMWPLHTTQEEGVVFRTCSSVLLSYYASFQFTFPTKKRRSEW